jgi:hypothetical protein
MKRMMLPLIALLSLIVALIGPSIARADSNPSQTVPFAETVTNPCNGDAVPLVGTFRLDSSSSTDSDGGQHVKTTWTGHGSSPTPAVPSGSSYQFSQINHGLINAKPPYPYIQNDIEDFHLVSEGSAPNFTLRITFHLTVNSNGVPAVQKFDYDTTCS